MQMVVGCCALLCAASAHAQQDTVVVAVVRADSADARAPAIDRGLTLGTEEASRTARLFGVAMRFLDADGLARDSAGARRIPVWIIAGDERRCARVHAALLGTDATIIDAGCRGTAEPAATELRIHPAPGDSIAALSTVRGDSAARVLLWHLSLERFGADQLNDRFRRRFSAEMDSDAWAAWAAVKIAAEACLRARARGASPRAVLADSNAAFDAHKGMPLRFDPRSRRLVQPLYVESTAAGATTIREIPPATHAP
ncbi:MAG TPA: hypothetical protein VHM30_12970 [Gemmatimonadaceae bacterium]|nr:hypothetical protein [Gemmatimonadaceae bacterium]